MHDGLSRKVIRITAEQSPNVKLGLAQAAMGVEPTGETIVPGVLGYFEYLHRRKHWRKDRQRVGLDALFPEDEGMLLFPDAWRDVAHRIWTELAASKAKRGPFALGCDSGEGSANTCVSVGDKLGVVELVSRPTKDTSVIPDMVVELGRKWSVVPERWMFDRGGGGYQHCCVLRRRGYNAQSVGFGEGMLLDIKRGITLMEERRTQREERAVYSNRRSEMYYTLSSMVDPLFDEGGKPRGGYGLPPPGVSSAADRLDRQLKPIPKTYDKRGEGVLCLPPKAEMIATLYNGEFSPDEADAVVLQVHGLVHKPRVASAGVS